MTIFVRNLISCLVQTGKRLISHTVWSVFLKGKYTILDQISVIKHLRHSCLIQDTVSSYQTVSKSISAAVTALETNYLTNQQCQWSIV